MKFMKLGTRPDTFYTEEATRTIISDIPSDLSIQINNVTYLLHKFSLLSKCGLLQQLCADCADSTNISLQLHDIPGGEDAFELCAKFCYGITISLSAHNFVSAICAAKFLRMTETVERGNLVQKLEAFFNSCILEGWKDSITTLEATGGLPEWSENLGIIRRCIDSIVEKILSPPSKVTWSYTYTRPGYDRKCHQSVPKDWWTEEISDLKIDIFRCLITAIRSTNRLPPQLIGEALHVYACRWLPDATKSRLPESSAPQTEALIKKNKRVLDNVVRMIPDDKGSVSVGFLLRLLSIANLLGAASVTKAELIRRSGQQLDQAPMEDLLLPLHSPSNQHLYDVDTIGAVVESFMVQWRRKSSAESNQHALRSIRKVGKLIDSYLQVVARDINMPVSKLVRLAESLPEIARVDHDDLYKAVNTYLKEHPDVTKAEKKRLCRMLDCQKLSPEVCAHVVKNERLPLRTVVQVLFFEQERGSRPASHMLLPPQSHPTKQQGLLAVGNKQSKAQVESEETSSTSGGTTATSDITKKDHQKAMTSAEKLQLKLEKEMLRRKIAELGSDKGGEMKEGLPKLDPQKIAQGKSKPEKLHNRSRER